VKTLFMKKKFPISVFRNVLLFAGRRKKDQDRKRAFTPKELSRTPDVDRWEKNSGPGLNGEENISRKLTVTRRLYEKVDSDLLNNGRIGSVQRERE